MIDERILFSEVWDGVEHRANAKVREGQSTKWHTYVQILYVYKLVVCLSTDGERA